MSRKIAVGYTVEEKQGNSWWFGHDKYDDADLLFRCIQDAEYRMDATGQRIQGDYWCRLVVWDLLPHQDDAVGIVLRSFGG